MEIPSTKEELSRLAESVPLTRATTDGECATTLPVATLVVSGEAVDELWNSSLSSDPNVFVAHQHVSKPTNIHIQRTIDKDTNSDDKVILTRKWRTSFVSQMFPFALAYNVFVWFALVFITFVDCDSPHVECADDMGLAYLVLIPLAAVGGHLLYGELRFLCNTTTVTLSRMQGSVQVVDSPLKPLCGQGSRCTYAISADRIARIICRRISYGRVNDIPVYRYSIKAMDANQIETELVPPTISELHDALYMAQEMERAMGIHRNNRVSMV